MTLKHIIQKTEVMIKKYIKIGLTKTLKMEKNITFKINNSYSHHFGSVYKIFKRKSFHRYIYMYDKSKSTFNPSR